MTNSTGLVVSLDQHRDGENRDGSDNASAITDRLLPPQSPQRGYLAMPLHPVSGTIFYHIYQFVKRPLSFFGLSFCASHVPRRTTLFQRFRWVSGLSMQHSCNMAHRAP